MILSFNRIVESILETLEDTAQRSDMPPDAALNLTVASQLLRHTQHVTLSGGSEMRVYASQAAELLRDLRDDKSLAGDAGATIRERLDRVQAEANQVVHSPLEGNPLKRPFAALLDLEDEAFGQMALRMPEVARPLLVKRALPLLQHYNQFALFGRDGIDRTNEVSSGEPLSQANLTTYLRARLDDPGAVVSNVVALTGGFGKQSTRFTVSSHRLNGDLVIRRDAPIDFRTGLGCHTADQEFPLLEAVYRRDFPVAEPLWQDSHSPGLAGPAFTVMRCVPGTVAGDSLSSNGKVSAALQQTLARVTARLHAIPRLDELAAIPAFAASRWDQRACDCARSYIAMWYRHYLESRHLPLPALHGLTNWLLDNVPAADDPACLVHGDIGFHNLLFNDGQLSAVLDWECSHVSDPAEDLGYIRSVMGSQLDWPAFLAEYGRAGRPIPGEERIHFFEIWANVKNALAIALAADHFEAGRLRDIKYGLIVYRNLPHFIARAEAMIADH